MYGCFADIGLIYYIFDSLHSILSLFRKENKTIARHKDPTFHFTIPSFAIQSEAWRGTTIIEFSCIVEIPNANKVNLIYEHNGKQHAIGTKIITKYRERMARAWKQMFGWNWTIVVIRQSIWICLFRLGNLLPTHINTIRFATPHIPFSVSSWIFYFVSFYLVFAICCLLACRHVSVAVSFEHFLWARFDCKN